jgi:hypothetical protein
MTLPSPGDLASVVNQLQESIEFSSDPRQNQEALSLMYKRTANAVNTKTGGLFSLTEQVNFEQFSVDQPTNATQTFANVYRKTFNLVALNGGNIGSSATVTFAHGITGIVRSTLIYCSCTSTTPQYFTSVYPNAYMTATNVVFVNPVATPLTSCLFVAEYTKT